MSALSIPIALLWDESLFESGHEEAENAYADFLCDFDAILGGISEKGLFFIEGRNMGWRRRAGSLVLPAASAQQFIAGAFPRTSEWALRGSYDPVTGTLSYTLFHHDAPTGEFYSVRAADEPPS